MIRETIIITQPPEGPVHIAPMGVHDLGEEFLIMPFRPSTTLDNLLASRCAVVNYTDDVRIFAGCLTGRRNWPLVDAEQIRGKRLANALAHAELKLTRIEEDQQRPRLYCSVLNEVNHAPFAASTGHSHPFWKPPSWSAGCGCCRGKRSARKSTICASA